VSSLFSVIVLVELLVDSLVWPPCLSGPSWDYHNNSALFLLDFL
jgi:hypothetical protein